MNRLLDCFDALFAFGIELDEALSRRAANPPYDQAQQTALALIDSARRQAMARDLPPAQVELAMFAVVAWIDEVLERHPAVPEDARWLQMQLFNSSNAATEFFHHLSTIPPHDSHVRAVYSKVLELGFKGQYYFEADEGGELGKLKRLHARSLAVGPPGLSPASGASPPQRPTVRQAPAPVSRRPQAVLSILVAALLLTLSGCLLWVLLKTSGDSPGGLAEQVDLRLQTFACSDLHATVSATGDVKIIGFVPEDGDKARVARDIAALPGVSMTDVDLQIRGWPHCEVVAILKPYQLRETNTTAGMTVAASSARDSRLREGDEVTIEVTMPSPSGFLWVDYFTADGAVMHLSTGRLQGQLRPGETVALGNDIPSSWLVSPPFGKVLVTALVSPQPLAGAAERPPFELASAYLPWLREAMARGKGSGPLLADWAFLETVPR